MDRLRRTLLLGGAAGLLAPSLARPDTRRAGPELRLSCVHTVVRPDLIRGVIEVTNIADVPLALADRWNSWGAYQWMIKVDGRRLARNPITAWDENAPSETVLAPGETRAARFYVVADGEAHDFPVEHDWPFRLDPPGTFSASTPVELLWTASAAEPRPAHDFPAGHPRRARGAARAFSRLIPAVPAPACPLP